MTAHELARLLLIQPDETVTIPVYSSGDDVLMEIKDVVIDYESGGCIVLKTYK